MRRIVVRERQTTWVVLDAGEPVDKAPSRGEAERIARRRARRTESRPAVEIEIKPGVWRTTAP